MCATLVETDEQKACPACGREKASWTLRTDQTRTLTVALPKARLECRRGEAHATTPARSAHGVAWRATEEVSSLPKDEARRLAARRLLPAPRDLLDVRVAPPPGEPTFSVTVTIAFEGRPLEERTFELERREEDLDEQGRLSLRFLCVHGEGGLDGIAFPWVHVLDVTEDSPAGHAPAIEVGGVRARKPLPLQVVAATPAPIGPAEVATATWTARLFDEAGRPLPGVDLPFVVGGVEQVVRTDPQGAARLATAATVSLRRPADDALRAGLARAAGDGQRAPAVQAWWTVGDDELTEDRPLEAGVPVAIGVRAWARLAELPGLHFDFDRSFLRPEGLADLREVAATLAKRADRRALIHGHTDSAGDAAYNKRLSERRARAVYAALTHDVAAWEALHAREGWGTREVQRMLNAVDGAGLAEDGQDGPDTQGAVKAFQAKAGLAADGKVGPRTRKALIAAYLQRGAPTPLSADRFEPIGGSPFMGCGEQNARRTEGRDEASRRVSILLVDPAAAPRGLPCRLEDLAPCRANQRPRDGSPCCRRAEGGCRVWGALSLTPRLELATTSPTASPSPGGVKEGLETTVIGSVLYPAPFQKLYEQVFAPAKGQSNDFVDAFQRELYRVYRTPTGRSVLDKLKALGKRIVFTKGTNEDSAKEHDFRAAHVLWNDAGTERENQAGSGSTLTFDPKRDKIDPAPWGHAPAAVFLGHELIHCLHIARGAAVATEMKVEKGGVTIEEEDPFGFVVNEPPGQRTKREELETTGVGKYENPTDPETENKLRAEWYSVHPDDKTKYPVVDGRLPVRDRYLES